MTDVINVGLVEDQFLFREGMKAIIASNPAIRVVFESGEGYSVVDKLRSVKVLPEAARRTATWN